MKYLLIGILIAMVGTLFSFFIWGAKNIISITGGIGLFFLGIAFLLSGVFASGDRMRANLSSETEEGRIQRHQISIKATLIALPNILIAVLFYYLVQ